MPASVMESSLCVDRRIGGLEKTVLSSSSYSMVDRRIGGLEKQWLNQETKKTVDRRIGGLEMRKGKA